MNGNPRRSQSHQQQQKRQSASQARTIQRRRHWNDSRFLWQSVLVFVSLLQQQATTATTHGNDASCFLICRLTTQDTLFHDEQTGRFYGQEEIVCDPYDDDNIHYNLYTLPSSSLIPANLWPRDSIDNEEPVKEALDDHDESNNKDLWVNITAASVNDVTEQVILSPTSTFTVISEPDEQDSHRRRWLQRKAYSQATGIRTYAILIVSTTDAQPTVSAQAMRTRFTHATVGMQAQYAACSANQLTWRLQGIHEVDLPGPLSDYAHSPSAVRNAATEQFLQRHSGTFQSMVDLADNVLYCIPPGTGGWVANAGTNYWRSQYNDAWCISLTAVVHELGHNLGLGHSNENGQPYSDWTGYMASGLPDEDKPRKCFNAANHAQLGWFADRTRTWKTSEGSRLVKVVAFVHYSSTTEAEPVILQFGQYYGQYNLATKHNEGTEEYKDEFVLVEQVQGATELRVHLQAGESVRISGTTVVNCGSVDSQPQSLLIGIGSVPLSQAGSLCNLPIENIRPRPTERPTDSPTGQPTSLPSPQPTDEPTDNPTLIPTVEPTANPTQVPTKAPSVKPSPELRDESSGLDEDEGSSSQSPTDSPTKRKNVFDRIVTPPPTGSLEEDGDENGDENGFESLSSAQPSLQPSVVPSREHSQEPSGEPSGMPSEAPSQIPSVEPSVPPSDAPSTVPPTMSPTETTVETNAPIIGTVEVQPDGTTASESAVESDEESRKAASAFLDAWEKLALGTTWFEWIRR